MAAILLTQVHVSPTALLPGSLKFLRLLLPALCPHPSNTASLVTLTSNTQDLGHRCGLTCADKSVMSPPQFYNPTFIYTT